MSMQVLDYEEGRDTADGKEPKRVLVQTGTGKAKWLNGKEFWAAVRSAKDFGIIGNGQPQK